MVLNPLKGDLRDLPHRRHVLLVPAEPAVPDGVRRNRRIRYRGCRFGGRMQKPGRVGRKLGLAAGGVGETLCMAQSTDTLLPITIPTLTL